MKQTLSIGIAAFNEAQNIGILLNAVLRQKIESAQLTEIVVVSDASTDETDAIVRSISSEKIKLIRLETRSGANEVQNTIMRRAESDILVMLDGDILPDDELFIEHLIEPILKNNEVGLTSARIVPASPRSFVEKVLVRNHIFKNAFFTSLERVNHIYLCFGPARALSRAFYSSYTYPKRVPCDAYSYLMCMKREFAFEYVSHTEAIFRCPSNSKDHAKQSLRFSSGRDSLIEEFGDIAKNAYVLPRKRFVLSVFKECVTHPILCTGYILLSLYVRITFRQRKFTSMWDTAVTSKKLQI